MLISNLNNGYNKLLFATYKTFTIYAKYYLFYTIKKENYMMHNNFDNVKTKIKNLMKAQGISVYKLAMDADISDTCIRNWFNSRNYTPSLRSLEKICAALGYSVVQLLLDEDSVFYPHDEETKKLLSLWNRLKASQKEMVLALLETFTNKE